ncbi:MAG: hypothetical protein RBS13_06530 [Bacteroidales bacterium]|jgi:hypothetical protein|nr:hypothetical protein [Bacteroidales bacterium]
MKTIKTFNKIHSIIFLLLAGIIFAGCKDNEDDDKIYYYDVYGEGYVYYRDTNLPIEGLKITLKADVDWGGQGLMFPTNPVETLYTDSKGYYRLHFIKKIYGCYPVRYLFNISLTEITTNLSSFNHSGGPNEIISLDLVDNAKTTIQFDTMKWYPE